MSFIIFVAEVSSLLIARTLVRVDDLLGYVTALRHDHVSIDQRRKLAEATSLLLELRRSHLVDSRGENDFVIQSQRFQEPGSSDATRGLQKVELDNRRHARYHDCLVFRMEQSLQISKSR